LFLFSPEEIKFSEYNPLQACEQLVTVKNITSVGKKITVLPLLGTKNSKKTVFSVESVKVFTVRARLTYQFPIMQGECGFVAPGMTFTFVIKFLPPNIESFKDEFMFRTEEEKITIPITAHRTPPLLDLPSTIHFGTCLVSQTKKVVIPVKNTGGQSNCRVRLLADEKLVCFHY
jgi:hypothetical protein